MTMVNFIDPDTLFTPESSLSKIALEANFLSNMVNTLGNALPAIFNKLKGSEVVLKNYIDDRELDQIKLPNNYLKAIDAAHKINYFEYGEKLISKPENFAGNFVAYAETLTRISSRIFKMRTEYLTQYIVILSSILTNKDDKVSLKDHTALFDGLKNECETFKQELKEFFTSKTGQTKTQFKNVVSRFADLSPLFKHNVILAKNQTKNNLIEVKKDVDQCVQLLDLIIKNIKNGKINNIGSAAALNISNGAYEVGQYVELVSIIYYDTIIFTKIVNDLAADLIEHKD